MSNSNTDQGAAPAESICGAENPDYPGEYACTYPVGHGPISAPSEDGTNDHGAPEAGAWWSGFPGQCPGPVTSGACPSCGHMPHEGRLCYNMASDNDCGCQYAAPSVGPVVEADLAAILADAFGGDTSRAATIRGTVDRILAKYPAQEQRTHEPHIFENCSCGDDGCARKVCVLCELVVDLHAPSDDNADYLFEDPDPQPVPPEFIEALGNTHEAPSAQPSVGVSAVIDVLNDLHASGIITYADYSRLHDMVSALAPSTQPSDELRGPAST